MDDDLYLAKITRSILEMFQVKSVRIVSTNEEAIKTFNYCDLDCIFVDNMMLTHNGLELTKYIRQTEDKIIQQIPIILCTAYTGLQDVIKARDIGVTEILAKPVSPDQIMEKLNNALFYQRNFVESKDYLGPDRRRQPRASFGTNDRRKVNNVKTNDDELVIDSEVRN